MPDIALFAHAFYLLGAGTGIVLVARSPLPAAVFWGVGVVLHGALAAAELTAHLGGTAFAGLEGDLRQLAFTLGMTGLALGAVFSLVVPPAAKRLSLFTGIGLAILIAVAADRLPIGTLPLPLILLGILMVAVLVGLRHRPVAARWLMLGILAVALAELARHRYLGFVPLPPEALGRLCFGAALAAFGLTAVRTR